MRTHDLHATDQAGLSPAARAVYDRLVSGTYEIDLERLADALLARFETESACGVRPEPADALTGDLTDDLTDALTDASLSSAR